MNFTGEGEPNWLIILLASPLIALYALYSRYFARKMSFGEMFIHFEATERLIRDARAYGFSTKGSYET